MAQTLREWITRAEDLGELRRIGATVDWDEEMGAITYLAHKEEGSPALLFENVDEYPAEYRTLFNVFASSVPRFALAMNEDPSITEKELIRVARDRFGSTIPPDRVDSGPVFENTDRGADVALTKFPVPKTWPKEGGRYIGTACAVISKNPDTGDVNVGTYRQMVHSDDKVGLYTSPGKDLRQHMQMQWERGEPLEVASVFGVSPALYLASSLSFSEEENEYEYAGGMDGSPIETVQGEVTDLPIPAQAEIVAEGRIYPDDTKPEGPFGEFTGYYGRPEADTPAVTVEAVHHRDDPILTCALLGEYPVNDEELIYGIYRSAGVWNDLDDMGVPGVQSVYCPPQAAAGTAMTIVSIEQQHAGHTSQVAALAGNCTSGAYFSKLIVVVDEDVDPTNIDEVIWALATRFDPQEDIDVLTDTWSTWLDPSRNPPEERPYGSKMLVDATKPHKHLDDFPDRLALREETYDRVAARWEELGFDGDPPRPPMFADLDDSSGPMDADDSDDLM